MKCTQDLTLQYRKLGLYKQYVRAQCKAKKLTKEQVDKDPSLIEPFKLKVGPIKKEVVDPKMIQAEIIKL